jgi:hypothetical protein
MTESEGSAAVEAVVIVPMAMLIVLLAVQMCLWAHAATLVQSAASTGEQTATALGGSPSVGQTAARTELGATGGGLVLDQSVQTKVLPGDVVEITVSGRTEAIIPWLHLSVSATRDGQSQEFRESG